RSVRSCSRAGRYESICRAGNPSMKCSRVVVGSADEGQSPRCLMVGPISRCRFSLALLFRTVTLIALALGWLLAVPTVPPQAFTAVIILVGMMLGGVATAGRL